MKRSHSTLHIMNKFCAINAVTCTLSCSDKLFCTEGRRDRRKCEVNTDISRFCRLMICIYRYYWHLHTPAIGKNQTSTCERFVNFKFWILLMSYLSLEVFTADIFASLVWISAFRCVVFIISILHLGKNIL